jgi:hypothetical protein
MCAVRAYDLGICVLGETWLWISNRPWRESPAGPLREGLRKQAVLASLGIHSAGTNRAHGDRHKREKSKIRAKRALLGEKMRILLDPPTVLLRP